jgi:hypothetical protein
VIRALYPDLTPDEAAEVMLCRIPRVLEELAGQVKEEL